MTVAQYIKENKKRISYREFTICDENNHIILDDRIPYLSARSEDYNKSWKAKCRGKHIVREWDTPHGICIQIA